MSNREIAARFALLKVLLTELTTAKKTADAQVREEWRPGDRLTATLPGGEDVGTVTLAKGKTVARLADEAAYQSWVSRVHADEIETVTVTRVNPDFTDRLMSAARQLGVAVDAETGEEVPGITVTEGDPYPMVRLADGARGAVAKAWSDGSLAELVSGLLAIEGGE